MPNLTFTLGPACAGGDHWDVTATLGSKSVTFPSSFQQLKEPLTKEDGEELSRLLLRLLVSRLSVKTVANARAKLAVASISLSID
ncbi:hypothetical protein LCGC14_1504180 [marine sediment metagenome]|uniref:Uncharacterized protein n=1 Tax=marine sediment metagenome TaxID=412755 RepID=A0A0F9J3L7_9ZZZZ